MHNTRYVVIFVTVLTVVVALLLSLLATGLQPIHQRNEAIYNKKAVLAAIESSLNQEAANMSEDQVQSIFDEDIQQVVVDYRGNIIEGVRSEDVDMAKERKKPVEQRQFPVYIYEGESGDKIYIVSVRGSGLWDEIWGNIALQSDFNTIAGASFDHKGETPGLGAEIKDNPKFSEQFEGKELYDGDTYTSVDVVKNGARGPHEVDGISGATITGNGVADMLEQGIQYYEPYFETIKKSN